MAGGKIMDNCRDSDKGWFKVISLGPCLSDIKDNFGVSSIKTLSNKVKMFFLRHYVLLKRIPYMGYEPLKTKNIIT